MDLSVCARGWCCAQLTTGALREVQFVRVRKEKFRRGLLLRGGRVLERRQLRIGYASPGYGSLKLRGFVVMAASKSAEGVSIDERKGRRVEKGRSLEELAEGSGSAEKQGRSLAHAVHESARVFLVGLENQKTLASRPWFPPKWLGADKNVWMKALSYQVRLLPNAIISVVNFGPFG